MGGNFMRPSVFVRVAVSFAALLSFPALLSAADGTHVTGPLVHENLAIYFVHGKSGFFLQSGGYEYALTMLVADLSVALTGPGMCALDNLVSRPRQRKAAAAA